MSTARADRRQCCPGGCRAARRSRTCRCARKLVDGGREQEPGDKLSGRRLRCHTAAVLRFALRVVAGRRGAETSGGGCRPARLTPISPIREGAPMSALKQLHARLSEQRGQTMAEYAVVLAVITVVIIASLQALAGGIGGALDAVTGILP